MVTCKADNRSRVKLPGVKPGQVFVWEKTGDTVKLTLVEPVEGRPAKFKLVKKAGFTVIETDRVVSQEKIQDLIDELP